MPLTRRGWQPLPFKYSRRRQTLSRTRNFLAAPSFPVARYRERNRGKPKGEGGRNFPRWLDSSLERETAVLRSRKGVEQDEVED